MRDFRLRIIESRLVAMDMKDAERRHSRMTYICIVRVCGLHSVDDEIIEVYLRDKRTYGKSPQTVLILRERNPLARILSYKHVSGKQDFFHIRSMETESHCIVVVNFRRDHPGAERDDVFSIPLRSPVHIYMRLLC